MPCWPAPGQSFHSFNSGADFTGTVTSSLASPIFCGVARRADAALPTRVFAMPIRINYCTPSTPVQILLAGQLLLLRRPLVLVGIAEIADRADATKITVQKPYPKWYKSII